MLFFLCDCTHIALDNQKQEKKLHGNAKIKAANERASKIFTMPTLSHLDDLNRISNPEMPQLMPMPEADLGGIQAQAPYFANIFRAIFCPMPILTSKSVQM